MNNTKHEPVFTNVSENFSGSTSSHSEQFVNLNIAVLRKSLLPESSGKLKTNGILFNFPEMPPLFLETELIEPYGADGISWHGRTANYPNCHGYLAISGLKTETHDKGEIVVAGLVVFDKQRFSLLPGVAGTVHIVRLDAAQSCGVPLHPSDAEPISSPADDIESYNLSKGVSSDGQDAVSTIHIMALYPPATKKAIIGGAKAIEAIMASAQLYANQGFHNSGILARVEITVQEHPVLIHAEVEALLEDVVGNRNAGVKTKPRLEAWNAVSAARDNAQASVVALLTDIGTTGTIGIASAMPRPPRLDASDLSRATFAMTLSSEFSATQVLVHELGHLLGAWHDRTQGPAPSGSPMYDHVRGYVPADRSFVTIMGYARKDMHYVPAFSASDRQYNGKSLGIPFGQPDAADAASFLRGSVHVVARYRGEKGPPWTPVDLQFDVKPPLGGTVTLSSLPPYPKGTIVNAKAISRADKQGKYQFSHWALDGKNVGSAPMVLVHMDEGHTLTAEFIAADGQFTLTVEQPPIESGLQIELNPPGPVFSSKARVSATLIDSDTSRSNSMRRIIGNRLIDHWLIDGKLAAGDRATLSLVVNANHKISVKTWSEKYFLEHVASHDSSIIEGNSTQKVTVLVVDRAGKPISNQHVSFSLIAPTGCKIVGDARVTTDEAGRASIMIHTGQVEGAIRLTATLESSQLSPLLFKWNLPRFLIAAITPQDVYVFPDNQPIPLEVQVREFGRPAKDISIAVDIDEAPEGIVLSHERAKTDERGFLKAVLNHTSKSFDSFEVRFKLQSEVTPVAVKFNIGFLQKRIIDVPRKQLKQVISVGHLPEVSLQVMNVKSGSDKELEPSNAEVYLQLSSGTTGLYLKHDRFTPDIQGLVSPIFGTPTGIGVATLTAHVDHAAPLIITIRVTAA